MNIIVAGAGTAGWLAALYANKAYPSASVTVVHDDKTPIIGVGEGTTPQFTKFMKSIDISTEELVKNCEATIKNGIKFTNWKGDGTHYFHPIFSLGIDNEKRILDAVSKGIDVEKTELASVLSEHNKIPLKDDDVSFADVKDLNHALHFNARKLAEYLEKVGVERGIKTVIGKITGVIRGDNDYVTAVELHTKQIIKTDFIFDCTGFARIFVDKVYKSPFRSYENSLPVKRAMPFFIDKGDTTPPFTEAIAMKYGWMWKIPVGNRFGCGYVYDSDHITDEEAYEEICEITKQNPNIPRKISFKPGYHTKPFNKNTVAIGLSHGFLEPLEATSLMIVILMLEVLPKIGEYNQSRVDTYNNFIMENIENVVDMLYMHYLTPRKDTDFWKNFKTNNVIPKHTSKTINRIKNIGFDYPNFVKGMEPFDIFSFIKCMEGVNAIDNEFIKNNKNLLINDDTRINDIINRVEKVSKKAKNHDDYLKYWSNN